MRQKAQIQLFPQQFKIMGPSDLIAMVQVITSNKDTPPDEMRYQLDDVFANWYVTCSISGEDVALCDLKYWDVPKQEVYARPELVPALKRASVAAIPVLDADRG